VSSSAPFTPWAEGTEVRQPFVGQYSGSGACAHAGSADGGDGVCEHAVMRQAAAQRNSTRFFMQLMIAKDRLEGEEDRGPDQNL
jgi:hypothetical protein